MSRIRQQRSRPGLAEGLRRLKADPARLQAVLAFGLLAVGIVAVERPLSHRLKVARASIDEARERARMAEEVAYFAGELETYEALVASAEDTVDWQRYVLERLGDTMVLLSVEPNPSVAQGPFKIVDIDLKVRSDDYQALLELIHRLEHGERALRVEELRLERQPDGILMSCVIRGLVKPELAERDPAPAGEGEPSPADAEHEDHG